VRANNVPKALVCLNTDSFAAEEVLTELKAYAGVEEAYRVHGAYDIIAKISGETKESLFDTVTKYIKKLRSVQTAHTMLIIESELPANEEQALQI
jgi:DNA-binding Lrp family transcriptional regulator